MDLSSKVSVMMPVFNGMPLIKASLQSLINQTYANWECVIVDDGSTDGTSEYLDKLKDSRFRVIHFEHNKGRPFARQAALDAARGKYLAMLDAEDLYHPEKLERQVKALREHPEVALLGCSMCSFGTNSDVTYKRVVHAGIFSFNGDPPLHASSMLRMDRAKSFHFNMMLNFGEDIDFLSRYLEGQKYMITEDLLYYYSEIDSASKKKLKASYKNGIRFGLSKLKSGVSIFSINGAKLLYSIMFFPFLKMETILKKRGIPLSESELQEFKSNFQALIKKS